MQVGPGPRRRRYDRYVERKSTLSERGYACVALENPNDEVNIGQTLRAALGFNARMVILANPPPGLNVQKLKTDPGRAYKHVPVLQTEYLFDAVPEDCVPVAVELTTESVDLVTFVHPERACYIFGPENGSISDRTLERCKVRVQIPTVMSLNLGMTVNIVLYDRLAKNRRRKVGPKSG